jgi:AcrR family transcriptional regulator
MSATANDRRRWDQATAGAASAPGPGATSAPGFGAASAPGPGEPDHRKSPRRRGGALLTAIFEATLAELAESSYAELSMERVACRARASKGSLYRRWPSRAELVGDAMRYHRPEPVQAPDTGNVRDDLLGFLRGMGELINSADGDAVRGLLAEAVRDPELARMVRERFIEPSLAQVLDVLRRGAVRGEVRPAALTHRMATVGPWLLRQHFMIYGGPVPDSVVVEIVDDVLMPIISAAGSP